MNRTILLETEKSKLIAIDNFIPKEKLERYGEFCLNLPLVYRPEIFIYDKVCRQQRNVGFFAKLGTPGYKYSGQETDVIDIENYKILKKIMKRVNKELNANYNGILVNLYENGERYISAHSDDEKSLDKAVGVASIAFGAVRKFRIRDKTTKRIIKDIDHQPGQLLIMTGDFQKEFTHEIPIQKKIIEPRVSLTFRNHKLN